MVAGKSKAKVLQDLKSKAKVLQDLKSNQSLTFRGTCSRFFTNVFIIEALD